MIVSSLNLIQYTSNKQKNPKCDVYIYIEKPNSELQYLWVQFLRGVVWFYPSIVSKANVLKAKTIDGSGSSGNWLEKTSSDNWLLFVFPCVRKRLGFHVKIHFVLLCHVVQLDTFNHPLLKKNFFNISPFDFGCSPFLIVSNLSAPNLIKLSPLILAFVNPSFDGPHNSK